MSDSAYFFLPDPDPQRPNSYFWRVVHRGDSLWKSPVSDTVYTMSNGVIYTWPFPTKDKFGRSYLEQERDR